MDQREPYWDYMGRILREERITGVKMIDKTIAEREIANMQEQVHVLQIRVKELTKTVYSLSHKVLVLGGDINQLELEL